MTTKTIGGELWVRAGWARFFTGFGVAALLATAGCSSEGFEPGGGGQAGQASGGAGGASGSGGNGGVGAEDGGGDSVGSDVDGGAGAAGMAGAAGEAGAGAAGMAGAAGEAGAGGMAGSGGGATGSANGVKCTTGADCLSGFCTDGVCCNSKCDGTCEACDLPSAVGSCTPYDKDTDPQAECLGSAKAGDACAGRCDGKGQCEFPGAATLCGSPVCAGGKATTYTCDGTSACVPVSVNCGAYTCGTSTCNTSCTTDAQCASGNYCKAGSCVSKQGNGAQCTGANQCGSGNCVDGYCCGSASCGGSLTCETGVCACAGTVCPSGQSCVYWYKDGDGDGFGDPNDKTLGCSGTAPPPVQFAKWVSNSSDCFDYNANAKPGQTGYFTQHRGDGSFDYDCNGQTQKFYPVSTATTCTDCNEYSATSCMFNCGTQVGTAVLYSMALECNGPTAGCGGPKVREAFPYDVACGTSTNLKSCSSNTCLPTVTSSFATQSCR